MLNLILFGIMGLILIQFFRVIDPALKLSFLDVGQGDAILIQTENHKNILVDAGPNGVAVERLGEELGFFDKTIDLFIMTHPDKDHFAGILDVFEKYRVKRVMMTGVLSDTVLYKTFLEQLDARSIPIVYARSDWDIQIGEGDFLDVLYPLPGENLKDQSVQNKNETSVVMRLIRQEETRGKPVAILTGDAEGTEESKLLTSGQALHAEVLKLGHHGSRTSTSDEFLSAVNSTMAIVSAGRNNSYGHPHPEVMEKVKKLKVQNTAEEGTIRMSFR